MKKILFIYNPLAGSGDIEENLDKIVTFHYLEDYELIPFELDRSDEVRKLFSTMSEDEKAEYSHILVAGGDGSINSVVNDLVSSGLDLPLGIIPTGTANDIANHIGMPEDMIEASKKILHSTPRKIDLGYINDRYFINVACMGLFTDVSPKTDVVLKNSIGRIAYYLKGIQQIPEFKKIPISLRSKEYNFDGDIYILLVFNGSLAGNMKLAYKAKVDDGLLDVIIVNPDSILDIFPLIIKLIMGSHLDEPVGIKYFQTSELYIDTTERTLPTDIDGELGPVFPLDIKCIKGGISILGF